METKVKEWVVTQLIGNGLAAQIEKADAKRRGRQAVSKQLRADLTDVAKTLLEGHDQRVTDGKTKQKMLDKKNRDQTQEFDLDEVNDGFELYDEKGEISGTALRKLAAAQTLIQQMRAKLEEGMDELDDDGNPILEDALDAEGNPIPDYELDDTGSAVMVDQVNKDGKTVKVPKVKGTKQVRKKVKLYESEEELNALLSDELYEPLKRRGLMPETFIPDECSKTKKMTDAAKAEYKKRLDKDERKGKAGKAWQFIQENKGLGMSVTNLLGAGVSAKFQVDNIKDLQMKANLDLSVAENKKTFDDTFKNQWDQFGDGKGGDRIADSFTNITGVNSKGEDVSSVVANNARMDLMSMGLDFATGKIPDAVDGMIEDPLDVKGKVGAVKDMVVGVKPAASPDEKVRRATVGKLVDNVVFVTGAALADAVSDGGLDVVVSTLFTSLVKTTPLIKALSAVPFVPGDADNALAGYAATLKATFVAADPDVGKSKAVLTAAGTAAADKFTATVTGAKLAPFLPDGLMAAKFDQVLDALTKAAAAAGTAAKSQDLTDLLNDEAATAGMQDKAVETINAEEEKAEEEEEKERRLEEAEAVTSTDDDRKKSLIEKRIAQLKRDQALLKWGASLGGLAFDVASKVLAPLAIGGSLIKIAQNLMQAIKRARDFVVFSKNQQDMFRAASANSAPIQNFLDNAAVQHLHYDAVAGIECLRLIGLILESTGYPEAVVAGKAVQLTASLASATEAVLYEAKKRYDLHAAWKAYKASLSKPANRKLALIAMKQNPTLAKYAIAWGAVIEKDPLVADFMRKTGLDDRTLADPNSSLDKVEEYLEARFPDDNVVTGRAYPMADWAPKNPEVTVLFWTTVKRVGTKDAGLLEADTKAVEMALVRFEAAFAAAEAKKDDTKTVLIPLKTAALETIEEVRSAFKGYHPMRDQKPKPIPHTDMQEVMGSLLDILAEKEKFLNTLAPPPEPPEKKDK